MSNIFIFNNKSTFGAEIFKTLKLKHFNAKGEVPFVFEE